MKKSKKYLFEEEEILSSQAFKRLKAKTQVYALSKNNAHITERMSHSLGVGITARLILKQLKKKYLIPVNEIQLNNICLLHDIGHPPFGHLFEKEVKELLKKDNIFFEGNANNLKIIEKENLKISKKTIVSLIKYPYKINHIRTKGLYKSQYKHYAKILIKELEKQYNFLKENNIISKKGEKLLEEISKSSKKISKKDCERIIKTSKMRLLETIIMEEADDITYLTQDFKDYITYISKEDFKLKIPKKYKKNKYIKILKNVNKTNISKKIKSIKNILIKDLYIDYNSYSIKNKSKEIKEIKSFFRNFAKEFFISQANEETNELINLKEYLIFMFNNIKNEKFIKKHIESVSYKEELLKETSETKKKKLMVNFISEKTDNWLLKDYNKHKKSFLK